MEKAIENNKVIVLGNKAAKIVMFSKEANQLFRRPIVGKFLWVFGLTF